MTDTISMGKRIRQCRRRRFLTQAELASRIGVEPLHICNIENGKKGISVDKLIQLCRCLHVSPSDLLLIDEQNDSELRQEWIDQIVSALSEVNIAQLGTIKTMVCSLTSE